MTYILQDMMFIHIPKTGGHSVLEVMKANGGYSLKDLHGFGNGFSYHEKTEWLREKLGEEYDSYRKVTLMRNPYQRAVGLWFGEAREGGHTAKGFRKWVIAQSKIRYKSKDKRIDPCTPQSWMIDPDVLVFDLAKIDELWAWMQNNLDIGSIKPPHVLSGKRDQRKPYRNYYSATTRRLVATANHRDIMKFRWKF